MLKHQKGFGLLETAISIVVFLLLVGLGTKTYTLITHNYTKARENQKLMSQVSQTVEYLSSLGIEELTKTKNQFDKWSKPQEISGSDILYRYRVVPSPVIDGKTYTNVVGVEIEYGPKDKGKKIKVDGRYVTLVSPSLAELSKQDTTGGSKTAIEESHDRYLQHQNKITSAKNAAASENETYLNPQNCYDPAECCTELKNQLNTGFASSADDGFAEKCDYRCFQRSGKTLSEWKDLCGFKICDEIPWTTAADCQGVFPSGSFQDYVCKSCVKDTCKPCCTDFRTLLEMGAGSIPVGYTLDPKCPEGCVDDFDYKVKFNKWEDLCGFSKKQTCDFWGGRTDYTLGECCQSNGDGKGLLRGWCGYCGPVNQGSQCDTKDCGDRGFVSNVDCSRMAWCGQPDNSLPTGWVPQFGNIRQTCLDHNCPSLCDSIPPLNECCQKYFRKDTTGSKHHVYERYSLQCPANYSASACCDDKHQGGWDDGTPIQCQVDGSAVAEYGEKDGIWDWWCIDANNNREEKECRWVSDIGCTSVYTWSTYTGSCRSYIPPPKGDDDDDDDGETTVDPPGSVDYEDGGYNQDNESSGGKE